MASKSREYFIVDGHLHVFDLDVKNKFPNRNDSHGFPEDKDIEAINRTVPLEEARGFTRYCGVNNVVFMQCYHDCPEEAQWVYDTASKKHPFIKGIVAGLDLTQHDKLEKYIKQFKSDFKVPKFVGIRNIVEHLPADHWLQDDVQAGLGILQKHDIPFDLQLRPDMLVYIPVLAKKFPKLKMVIDHIANPYHYSKSDEDVEKWKEDMKEVAKHENVYVKLSGMINSHKYWSVEVFKPCVDHLLECFGTKRCFFGSDWPVCRMATDIVDYPETLKLLEDILEDRSTDVKRAIFQENVIEFYNLQEVVDFGLCKI